MILLGILGGIFFCSVPPPLSPSVLCYTWYIARRHPSLPYFLSIGAIYPIAFDAAAGATSAFLGGGCRLKSVTPRCGAPTGRQARRGRWYRPRLLLHLGARSTADSTRKCACPRERFPARTWSSARPAKRYEYGVRRFFFSNVFVFFFLFHCLFAYLPFFL